MRMTTIAPSPALASLVRSFTIVETDAEVTRTLLPETGALLGIRYGGAAALIEHGKATVLSDVTLTGMRNTVRRMRTSAGGGIIVTSFHEDGAGVLFGVPMNPLFNEVIGAEHFASVEDLEELRVAVATAKDLLTRVCALEQFLMARKPSGRRDLTVLAAVRAMRVAHGAILIRSLAAGLGLSQDRLEKRFRQAVGTSPKQYCSILRLRYALGGSQTRSLVELALEAGYYDQSHFVREFRAITGEPPRKFFASTEYC
jgi:AraC-like DNA-binding protein